MLLILTMQESDGTWFPLHSEVVMENGQILCTRNPTGHRILIDYRFELPCGKLCVKSEQKSVSFWHFMHPKMCSCCLVT